LGTRGDVVVVVVVVVVDCGRESAAIDGRPETTATGEKSRDGMG
jgi:hypothetical protein